MEVLGNNRSVMPLDVLGRTRATLTEAKCTTLGRPVWALTKLRRAGDSPLQFLDFNEEFLVIAIHQIAVITSLPFVHTARRYYRLNGLVRPSDCGLAAGNGGTLLREVGQTWSFRGKIGRASCRERV